MNLDGFDSNRILVANHFQLVAEDRSKSVERKQITRGETLLPLHPHNIMAYLLSIKVLQR